MIPNPYRDRRLAELFRQGVSDAQAGKPEAYPGPEPRTKGTDWRQTGAYRKGYRAGVPTEDAYPPPCPDSDVPTSSNPSAPCEATWHARKWAWTDFCPECGGRRHE